KTSRPPCRAAATAVARPLCIGKARNRAIHMPELAEIDEQLSRLGHASAALPIEEVEPLARELEARGAAGNRHGVGRGAPDDLLPVEPSYDPDLVAGRLGEQDLGGERARLARRRGHADVDGTHADDDVV